MSQLPVVSDGPAVDARVSPVLTWAGGVVKATGRATHYLHLAAFPCAKCNGPVIVGSLGTRHDEIAKETEITEIGAVCLACGRRPEVMIEPSAKHRFRQVEWEWVIKKQPQPEDPGDDQLAAELSQDADTAEAMDPSTSR
jgi:hypothetical protein